MVQESSWKRDKKNVSPDNGEKDKETLASRRVMTIARKVTATIGTCPGPTDGWTYLHSVIKVGRGIQSWDMAFSQRTESIREGGAVIVFSGVATCEVSMCKWKMINPCP